MHLKSTDFFYVRHIMYTLHLKNLIYNSGSIILLITLGQSGDHRELASLYSGFCLEGPGSIKEIFPGASVNPDPVKHTCKIRPRL